MEKLSFLCLLTESQMCGGDTRRQVVTRAAQGFREPSTQQQDWYLLLSERYDVTSSQLLLQFLTKLSEMDCMRVACKPDVS